LDTNYSGYIEVGSDILRGILLLIMLFFPSSRYLEGPAIGDGGDLDRARGDSLTEAWNLEGLATGDERAGDERAGDERAGDERAGDEGASDEGAGDKEAGDRESSDCLDCVAFVINNR
jgi:hypothetical protein